MSSALKDGRARLAYINQHRELTIGLFLVLAAMSRWLFSVPMPGMIIVSLLLWFLVSIAFVYFCRRIQDDGRLGRYTFTYFVLEVATVTVLVHYAGGADWLGILFFCISIVYANVLLPPRQGKWITLLACSSFTGLVTLEYLHVIPHVNVFPAGQHFDHSGYVFSTVIVGAFASYFLIGYTSAHFSRMLTGKAVALEAANSELKNTSQELRHHKNNLEELVKQRTSDLAHAYEELRRANTELVRLNELKSNFLSNVSHELRTPLTSIRSFSEILLSYPDEDVHTRTEFLEIIKSESERLTRLINDVLDLAKIDAGRVEWRRQQVDVADLLFSSAEIMKGWAETKGLPLEVGVEPGLPTIYADYDRLVQVITNLLNNALKFTDRGYVKLGAFQRDGELVMFVEDTGRGVPAVEQEIVFEKFYQGGDSLTSKPEGTGLGLAICREIIEHHQGRIWLESEPGKGSRFSCALPLTCASTAVDLNSAAATQN